MKDRGEEPPPPEEDREAETAFDGDDRDEEETNELEWDDTTFGDPDDDLRENLDEMREADRDLGRGIGVKRKKITDIKKETLFELGYKLRKGDGKKSAELFNRLKLTMNEKTGNVNGMKFDNVKIIILGKNKKYKFSENKKFALKIDEFKILAEEAWMEHERTAFSNIEEVVSDVFVDDEHAESILGNSLEKLNEEISDREDKIIPLLTEKELREFRGFLKVKLPTLEEREEGGISVKDRLDLLKLEENNWMERANDVEGNPERKNLYETITEVVKLKSDQLRLEANLKPESEFAQNILEEETENNPLTRFERFKKWSKENLGGISVIAISVAGIITTIVMGMKTVVVGGAKAASKFGKFLAKLAEKAGPVLGALLNLAAGLLKLGAKGVSFLAENLWILAVLVAYALWDRAKKSKK